jgi:nucleoside-diphosphate-sugar epimerase
LRPADTKSDAFGKVYVRSDLTTVVVTVDRLPQPPLGQVYHLCSGRAYRLGDLLKALILLADRPIKINRDRSLLRKADIPILQGDFRVTTKAIGWKPEIDIARTLTDTLRYWREKT